MNARYGTMIWHSH